MRFFAYSEKAGEFRVDELIPSNFPSDHPQKLPAEITERDVKDAVNRWKRRLIAVAVQPYIHWK